MRKNDIFSFLNLADARKIVKNRSDMMKIKGLPKKFKSSVAEIGRHLLSYYKDTQGIIVIGSVNVLKGLKLALELSGRDRFLKATEIDEILPCTKWLEKKLRKSLQSP
jgi:hypothetical protein